MPFYSLSCIASLFSCSLKPWPDISHLSFKPPFCLPFTHCADFCWVLLGWTITHSRMLISFDCAESKGREGKDDWKKKCRSYTLFSFLSRLNEHRGVLLSRFDWWKGKAGRKSRKTGGRKRAIGKKKREERRKKQIEREHERTRVNYLAYIVSLEEDTTVK